MIDKPKAKAKSKSKAQKRERGIWPQGCHTPTHPTTPHPKNFRGTKVEYMVQIEAASTPEF